MKRDNLMAYPEISLHWAFLHFPTLLSPNLTWQPSPIPPHPCQLSYSKACGSLLAPFQSPFHITQWHLTFQWQNSPSPDFGCLSAIAHPLSCLSYSPHAVGPQSPIPYLALALNSRPTCPSSQGKSHPAYPSGTLYLKAFNQSFTASPPSLPKHVCPPHKLPREVEYCCLSVFFHTFILHTHSSPNPLLGLLSKELLGLFSLILMTTHQLSLDH